MELVLLIASLAHVFEEFVFPGGFGEKFKGMMLSVGKNISNAWLIATNVVFLSVVLSVFLVHNAHFKLSVVSIVFLNACLHIGRSIYIKGYFPGFFTALFFYVPIYIWAVIQSQLSIPQVLLSLLFGLLLHGVPFIYLFFLKSNSNKSL